MLQSGGGAGTLAGPGRVGVLKRKLSIDYSDMETTPSKKQRTESSLIPQEIESALQRSLVSYRIHLTEIADNDIFKLLKDAVMTMQTQIEDNRDSRKSKGIKFFMALVMEFVQASNPSVITVPPVSFHSECQEVYEDTNLEDLLHFASLPITLGNFSET